MQHDTTDRVRLQRRRLLSDAERVHTEESDNLRQEWIDPTLWREYMGKAACGLYESFSNDELLDILRVTAEDLGHPPSQKDVFCVYRSFINRRFTNWPTALRAAGLKPPKNRKQKVKGQDKRS